MRTLKNIGILLAALLSAIQLFSWISAFRVGQLEAELTYGPYKMPEEVNHQFRQNVDRISPARIDTIAAALLKNQHLSNDNLVVRVLINDISMFLIDSIQRQLSPDLVSLGGYWEGRIENSTSQSVDNVMIEIPGARRVCFSRSDNPLSEKATGSRISIGTLQPKEGVTLFVWTANDPSWFAADEIVLTHDRGVGTLSIRHPASGVVAWVDHNTFLLTYLLFMLAVVAALAAFQKLGRRVAVSSTTSDSDTGAASKSDVGTA